jgi:hypothetical protein
MIIAIGDVHGKFDQLILKIQNVLMGNTGVNFVQLGDFGLGFGHPKNEWSKLNELNQILLDSDSKLYVIRGNHDNPALWYKGIRFEFSNIQFVIDDTLLLIEDKYCYFAGGAISVDRSNRRQGVDYWSDEGYASLEWVFGGHVNGEFDRIDFLFTHDVYHPCSPYSISNSHIVNHFAKVDKRLIPRLMESQEEMKILYYDIVKISPNFTWYHGHYHESHVTNNNEQITHSLSELEFKEVR